MKRNVKKVNIFHIELAVQSLFQRVTGDLRHEHNGHHAATEQTNPYNPTPPGDVFELLISTAPGTEQVADGSAHLEQRVANERGHLGTVVGDGMQLIEQGAEGLGQRVRGRRLYLSDENA